MDAMDIDRHPLVQSLREAGELDSYFDMPVCDPNQSGWSGATELFQGDDARLKKLVMSYGYERWGTNNNHVASSAFIIAYLTRFIYPMVGQYVLRRRVLKVTLANLAFHRSGGRIDATGLGQPQFAVLRDDPAANHPDAEVLNDERELYTQLKEWAFKSNLEIVIEALNRSVRASLKVSQNAVAASCAQAIHRLYPLVEDKGSVIRDTETFFEDPSSPLYRQVTMEVIDHQGKNGLFARRAGCCLVWRTRNSSRYCSNCILRPREEQTRSFKEMLIGVR
jgi:ferric iron reductase protein FhuF